MGKGSELVTCNLVPHHETERAMLFSLNVNDHKDTWFWLPKFYKDGSQCIYYDNEFQMGDRIDVQVPQWLCDQRGLG